MPRSCKEAKGAAVEHLRLVYLCINVAETSPGGLVGFISRFMIGSIPISAICFSCGLCRL